jgi:predicted nucleic acid-binding protein
VIFIDTGAFIARYSKRDQYHVEAIARWNVLQSQCRPCFTSSFVLDETITLLGQRTSYQFAAERAKHLWQSTALTILRPDETDERAAMGYFEKYADQRVSFTDCISFALMQRRKITSVFSFDRHFSFAGFQVEP